jgi:hypothetical protein
MPIETEPQRSIPHWKLTLASDVFAGRTFKQLPPRAEAQVLAQEMLDSYNVAFPIFDRALFLNTFEAHYPCDERENLGWWACLNVVFTLAHRFRAMRTLNDQAANIHAWGYLQNALAVVTELTMQTSELLAIQAILGLAIVLQGTPNSRSSSVLISTALKLAWSMKLHRQDQGPSVRAAEIRQRKRVFWIAYIIDKDISLRTGDPSAQDDDDMDVDLPSETTEPNPGGASGVNFFNIHIGLAIIQGQIYKSLISTKALKQTETERSLAAKDLDSMLVAWKQSVPIDFASDTLLVLGASGLLTMLHAVIMNFTYFHALDTIHRSFRAGFHLHPESMEPVAQLLGEDFPSTDICLAEARKLMQLIPMMPQGDYAWVWLLLEHIILAATTILSHVISSSTHTLVKEDLKLVEPVLKLLAMLENKEENSDLEKMEESLRNLWKEAREVVDRAERRKKKDSDGGDVVIRVSSYKA